MLQWEYTIVDISQERQEPIPEWVYRQEQRMGEYGREGWELVTVLRLPDVRETFAMMRRPKTG